MSSNMKWSLETSSMNSCKEQSTTIIAFERIISVAQQSSEDSTSNGGTLSRVEYE